MNASFRPSASQTATGISVEAALEIVLNSMTPTPVETRPLASAAGRALAQDVSAPVDLPSRRVSAMDGFALRLIEDTQRSVAGVVMAGDVPWTGVLGPETALRVMTGATVPGEADAVIRLEDTIQHGSVIELTRAPRHGENIREIGSDLNRGERAVAAGVPISWAEIGLLASLGIHEVAIHRAPVVAVISTGDELLDSASPGSEGATPDSNGPMLVELIRRCGGEPRFLGIAGDDPGALVEILGLAGDVDAIVISGGVSAGDRDVVRDLLVERDAIVLSQVRMRPGRPFTFGALDGRPFFALPGNPLAAAATFLQFVRPAIARLRGIKHPEAAAGAIASVSTRIENPGERRLILPVRLHRDAVGQLIADRVGDGVAGLAMLARADGLLVIPESIDRLEAGDTCEVWPLHR